MAIELNTPIVLPAQEERVVDRIWINKLIVNATGGLNAPVSCRLEVIPYSSATGEMVTDKKRLIILDDLFTETDEKIQIACQAIYDAVEDICESRDIFADPIAPEIVEENNQYPELPTQLDSLPTEQ